MNGKTHGMRRCCLQTLSVSCSILDNEYTIIVDTFARIRVGIDRIQCKNAVITHVFYKTDHPEHTKTHVFYKTDRQEIAQDSPGEPREPRQPREPSSAQKPRKPKLHGFLQVLGITVNNDVFEERIKQRKNT